MIETFGPLLAIFTGSVFVEAVLDYFIPKSDSPREWVKYVAAAFGISFCIVYRLDLLALFGLVSDVTYAGAVVTGVLMGRGSNFIHDIVSLLKRMKQSSSL